MNEKQKKSRKKRLLSSAKALLTLQVGITVGCLSISNKLYWLGEDWSKQYPFFDDYRENLPLGVPIGTERLEWNDKSLLEVDIILAKYEYENRENLLIECQRIINDLENEFL